MHGWSVVMTKPNCENIAVTNLKRQGYDCYFPRFAQETPGKPTVIRPLFPRYIFVIIADRWYSIRGTRGVSYPLLGENGPAIIPEAIINNIKSKENDKGFIILTSKDKLEKFSEGDKVKVTEGPFSGIDMIYQGMTSQDRVRVLAEMLGQQVQILIEEKLLTTA